jgi:hypothetical protein
MAAMHALPSRPGTCTPATHSESQEIVLAHYIIMCKIKTNKKKKKKKNKNGQASERIIP